ncbi:MAG: prolipoprotein diacylglyceryl transferase [Oligoflexia bacterium]|nr:prolipoprotein diacylglyceryl transferase [Oligoflexia bacterium]
MPAAGFVHHFSPFAIQFSETFGIRWYGLAYLAGFVAGYYIIRWMSRRGLTPLSLEHVGDFVFNVAVGTIVGGRLGYCLLYSPDLFTSFKSSFPFWGVLAINEGGMASHGGICGILVASMLFARKHGVDGFHLADLTTFGGSIGIFFGRIANFVNGELVGRPCQTLHAWCVKFPHDILSWPTYEPEKLVNLTDGAAQLGVSRELWISAIQRMRFDAAAWELINSSLTKIVESIQSGNQAMLTTVVPALTARHPSQLYEAVLEGLLIFLIMFGTWYRARKPGVIFSLFFICYSLVRIAGEQFRMPDLQIGFQSLGLTRGQWLSLGLLAFGLSAMVLSLRRRSDPMGGWGAPPKK